MVVEALQEEYVAQGGDGGRVPRTWVVLGPRWHVPCDPTPHLERQPTAAHSTHKKRNTDYIKRSLRLSQLDTTLSFCECLLLWRNSTIWLMVTLFQQGFHKSLFCSCSYNEACENIELVPTQNGKQGKGKERKYLLKYTKTTQCTSKRKRCNGNDLGTMISIKLHAHVTSKLQRYWTFSSLPQNDPPLFSVAKKL